MVITVHFIKTNNSNDVLEHVLWRNQKKKTKITELTLWEHVIQCIYTDCCGTCMRLFEWYLKISKNWDTKILTLIVLKNGTSLFYNAVMLQKKTEIKWQTVLTPIRLLH